MVEPDLDVDGFLRAAETLLAAPSPIAIAVMASPRRQRLMRRARPRAVIR